MIVLGTANIVRPRDWTLGWTKKISVSDAIWSGSMVLSACAYILCFPAENGSRPPIGQGMINCSVSGS